MRTDVLQITEHFIPTWIFLEDFKEKDEAYKKKQKLHYNRAHRTRDIDLLPEATSVWVRTKNSQCPGTVVSTANAPRSYLVSTSSGQVRRN